MKSTKNMIIIFLLFSIIISVLSLKYTELKQVTFGDDAESIIKGTGIFKIVADYKKEDLQKYLYIYPLYYDSKLYINKAIFKIYFKEITDKETDVNYLDSDYSTLDFNSGLLIKINTLKYNKANIYVITYGNAEFKLRYKYANDVNFPKRNFKTNFELSQFTLEKGETKTINYEIQTEFNEYLLVLSKTSLRNIEVTVKYKDKDYTKVLISSLYPNGCSLFIDSKDKQLIDFNTLNFYITIKNKNVRDETLLLGFMHHKTDEIFTDELINGYQIYLESNNNKLLNLPNVNKGKIEQYFTYQIFSKRGEMQFLKYENVFHIFTEYNSMLHYNIDTSGDIAFEFYEVPQRNSLYIQYIDYNDIEVAQKVCKL